MIEGGKVHLLTGEDLRESVVQFGVIPIGQGWIFMENGDVQITSGMAPSRYGGAKKKDQFQAIV